MITDPINRRSVLAGTAGAFAALAFPDNQAGAEEQRNHSHVGTLTDKWDAVAAIETRKELYQALKQGKVDYTLAQVRFAQFAQKLGLSEEFDPIATLKTIEDIRHEVSEATKGKTKPRDILKAVAKVFHTDRGLTFSRDGYLHAQDPLIGRVDVQLLHETLKTNSAVCEGLCALEYACTRGTPADALRFETVPGHTVLSFPDGSGKSRIYYETTANGDLRTRTRYQTPRDGERINPATDLRPLTDAEAFSATVSNTAVALLYRGKKEASLELCQEALQLSPQSSDLLWKIAEIQFDLGRVSDARKSLFAAVKLEWGDAALTQVKALDSTIGATQMRNRFQVLFKGGDEAALYEKLLKDTQKPLEALSTFQQGESKRTGLLPSEREFLFRVAQSNGITDLYNALGNKFGYVWGNTAATEKALKGEDPEDTLFRRGAASNFAQHLLTAHHFDQAKTLYQALANTAGESVEEKSRALLTLAQIEFVQGHTQTALTHCNDVLSIPEMKSRSELKALFGDALFQRARAHAKMGTFDAAENDISACIKTLQRDADTEHSQFYYQAKSLASSIRFNRRTEKGQLPTQMKELSEIIEQIESDRKEDVRDLTTKIANPALQISYKLGASRLLRETSYDQFLSYRGMTHIRGGNITSGLRDLNLAKQAAEQAGHMGSAERYDNIIAETLRSQRQNPPSPRP